MKRRSDAPLTILGLGIAAVVLLGVGVITSTGQTPVLQLPPAIKARWGYEGVVARFKKGAPPWLEVELPAAATTDRLRMTEVGALAILKYRELAPRTLAEWVVVRIKDRADVPEVTVTSSLAVSFTSAQGDLGSVLEAARSHGANDPDVQLLGLSSSGVDVRVTGRARRGDAADRTAAAVTSISWVGRVEVELEGARGPLTSVGGRDAPRRRR